MAHPIGFFFAFCVGFYTSLVLPLLEVSVRGSQKYEFCLPEMVRIEIEEKRVLCVVQIFFGLTVSFLVIVQKLKKCAFFSFLAIKKILT